MQGRVRGSFAVASIAGLALVVGAALPAAAETSFKTADASAAVTVAGADASVTAVPQGTYGVSGTVRSAGTGAAGAEVTLLDKVTGKVGGAITDASGHYTIDSLVPPGTYNVQVLFKGSSWLTTYLGNTTRPDEQKSLTISDRSLQGVDVAVHALGSVTGRILDVKGKPVKGIKVYAGHGSDLTDSNGRYRIYGVEPGRQRVIYFPCFPADIDEDFSCEETSRPLATVTSVGGREVVAKTVKLAGGRIAGHLVTKTKNTSLPSVSLFDAHKKFVATTRSKTVAGYAFAFLTPGTYYVSIDGSNLPLTKAVVKATGTTKIAKKTLGAQTRITGLIRDSKGKVVTSATPLIYVRDANGTQLKRMWVTSGGRYSAWGVVKGTYTVQSGGPQSAKRKIVVRPGHTAKVDLVLPSGKIKGVVTNAHGQPMSNVWVGVQGQYEPTDEKGRYSFSYVGSGSVTVTFEDLYSQYGNRSQKVLVKPGHTATVTTVLR